MKGALHTDLHAPAGPYVQHPMFQHSSLNRSTLAVAYENRRKKAEPLPVWPLSLAYKTRPGTAFVPWRKSSGSGTAHTGTRTGQEGIRQRRRFSELTKEPLSLRLSHCISETHTHKSNQWTDTSAVLLRFGTNTQCPIRDPCQPQYHSLSPSGLTH